jgi:VIT1/CCC1 family predicted Fe2+/Mn2+ transporter
MMRRRLGAMVLAALLIAGLTSTSWRLAVLVGLTAVAIALTRLRYCAAVALTVLALTLVLAQTGRSADADGRNAPTRTPHR